MLKETSAWKRCSVLTFAILLVTFAFNSFSLAGPLASKTKLRKRAGDKSIAPTRRGPTATDPIANGAGSRSGVPPREARIEELEHVLERQGEQLAELRRVIEEQQQVIQTLVAKTHVNESQESIAAGGDQSPSASTVATSSREAATNAEPRTQGGAPSIEQRVQRVEDRVKSIGPLKITGDFRLRLDATLRGATRTPDPPLTHQQNVRMRYRMRLNLDTDINPEISFHGQLATGPLNNALTQDQDFTSTVARHPLMISEAWIDYHPSKTVQLQGGRVQSIFADNSRFLFDDDVRFNGFNEKYVWRGGEKTTVEARAGQYWFTNPNVAVVAPGSPLDRAAANVGSIGRSSMLFHQGLLANYQQSDKWTHQLGGDVQLFRQPNQIQLASIADGAVLLVQPGLGIALSGPMSGTGSATTAPGGAVYTARDFYVTRLTYRLNHSGVALLERTYPLAFNFQVARNAGTGANERDAMLLAFQIGKPSKPGEMGFTYVFAIKGANSMISQLTDDDLGTGSGVNVRTHHFRWDIGLANRVTLQSLVFVQRQLRTSGQYPNFFVPVGAFAPRQYRFQEQVLFTF